MTNFLNFVDLNIRTLSPRGPPSTIYIVDARINDDYLQQFPSTTLITADWST